MAGVVAKNFSVNPLPRYDSQNKRDRWTSGSANQHGENKHHSLSSHEAHNKQCLVACDQRMDTSPTRQLKILAKKSVLTSSHRKEEFTNGYGYPKNSEKRGSPKREILVSHRREISPKHSQSPSKTLVNADSKRKRDKDHTKFSKRPESAPVYPKFKDVKRRLAFDQDDDQYQSKELDFTEKLAAFRSLIGAQRSRSPAKEKVDVELRDRELKSSHRKSERAPLFRERPHSEMNGVGGNGRDYQDNVKQSRIRDEKNVEVEEQKDVCDERLSSLSVDIHALKVGLLQRHREKAKKSAEKSSSHRHRDKMQVVQRDSGLRPHSSLGIGSHRNSKEVHLKDKPVKENKANLGNSKNLEDQLADTQQEAENKQTQTSYLNHSHNRSVQSNVPFFEPASSLRLAEKPGKHSNETPQRTYQGIADGVNIGEPGMRTSLSASVHDKRQTNVDSFVGNLTPEKDKEKRKLKSKVKEESDGVLEQEKLISDPKEKYEKDILRKLDVRNSKYDSGNRRRIKTSPVDENESISAKLRRINKLLAFEDEPDDGNKISVVPKKVEKMDITPADKKCRTSAETKSENKVREWIETQQTVGAMTPGDTGPMTLEELSVSVSCESGPEEYSPRTDSCDKVPVKLEKSEAVALSHKPGGSHAGLYGTMLPQVKEEQLVGSRSLTREKNRLELEFPVRDLPTSKAWKKVRDSVESITADSASSIFSLPFSVRSGESVSTTVQAVKLLRKLYGVEPEKRQDLVLLAKCFRRWINNVLKMKERTMHVTESVHCNPVSYGVMLRKAEIFYRTCVINHSFDSWKQAMSRRSRQKAVAALHRRHTLQKGMNAFKWAINRSKLRQGILQDRINSILLYSSFMKWRSKAEENRHHRLQVAFTRWRQFTKEAQKIRLLRTQANNRLKHKVFQDWCEHFRSRLKQNKADSHFRVVLLSQGWDFWRIYTLNSKEKKHRQKLAIEMYEENLQKKMFVYMKVEFIKYTKAKRYQKTSQLKQAMRAWMHGAKISYAERAADHRVAREYWARATVRAHFTAWRDGLLNRKACRMSNRILTMHAFNQWNMKYQRCIKRRSDIEQYIQRRVMMRALKHWRYTVMMMKKRRAVAVELLETVLQRHVIERWQAYTLYQRQLRRRLELHLRKKDLLVQRECLLVWRTRFQDRCDEQQAQHFWSNTCARKAVEKWRLICRKRSLQRLLEETEPMRQLQRQRVMFARWQSALGLVDEEKKEAADLRTVLQHSLMRKLFQKWRIATLQLLTIKPTVLRQRMELISRCFVSWHEYVTHKAECRKSESLFMRVQLRHTFSSWRRQYLIHQIEKSFSQSLVEKRARQCVQSWYFIIKRKHSARQFHERKLVQTAFLKWNTCTIIQLRRKKMEQEEMEIYRSVLHQYFNTWREGLCKQHRLEEITLASLQQEREHERLRKTFSFWRRHFRATLVARENEKIRTRRLAKQALYEWHMYTHSSLSEAVRQFAAAIGLSHEFSRPEEEEDNDPHRLALSDRQDSQEVLFEPMNFGMDSPRVSSYVPSPRVASSYGTPLKRLFSPAASRHSLTQSLEFDNTSLINSSFLDARFEMEQAVKTESKREIVVTVVSRLRHWPVSIVFEAWRDYTSRHSELKRLAVQMGAVQEKLILEQHYKTWVKNHTANKMARLHRDQVLMRKALFCLYQYGQMRKQKKQLSALAHCHFATKIYQQVFPMWLVKAQEKSRRDHIIHLWGNITPEEQALIPRERGFRYSLNRKSVKHCFTSWARQYRKISALKRAYHKILLDRYFGDWLLWAHEKHERREKCQAFRERRIKSLVFKTWCLRHTQKTEVAQRFKDAWSNYLTVIIQSWHVWAHAQHTRTTLGTLVARNVNQNLVSRTFTVWKETARKQLKIKQWYQTRLIAKSLTGWRAVAAWQKDMRQKVATFQIHCYTQLASRSFSMWRAQYRQRLREHEEHRENVERCVLEMARHWRRKAQTSRGKLLYAQIQQQHVQQCFMRWRAAYDKILEREDVLQSYLARKNNSLLSEYLDQWRSALLGEQAQRLFNMKLLAAFLENWKITARACKERRTSMQIYQRKRADVKIKGLFSYWANVTKVRKSIRGHANLRIQLTVFKAWLMYTRRKQSLQRLEMRFVRLSNQRTLQKYWYTMKARFDYCVVLTETARKVQQEKDHCLMKRALEVWSERLKRVIAAECYEHLLARRVARNWCRLVQRRRDEREQERKQTELATKYCNKKLCKLVFGAWYDEILIKRQVKKHKAHLILKCWHVWKLRVDMIYTAKCVYEENLYKHAWTKWHMTFARLRSIRKMEALEKKQCLTMVFVSWRNLVMKKKRQRRTSQIPLPISPALSMPSSGSTGSSTPTDELSCSSPVPLNMLRPSQIPAPTQGSKGASGGRNKPRPGTLGANSDRNTQTNITGRSLSQGHNGRNTPTSPSAWK